MPYALGAVKPHVRKAAEDIGARFGVGTILGVGPRAEPDSDHPKGLALDFMTYGDLAKGDSIASYVFANSNYYGVHYIIWKQHIWNRDRASEGWRLMKDRGSATANHFDHVHVSFVTSGQFAQMVQTDNPVAPGPIDPVPPNDPRLPKGIGPLGPIEKLQSSIDAIGNAFAFLTNSHNWLRVGMFLLGSLLILGALVMIAGGNNA